MGGLLRGSGGAGIALVVVKEHKLVQDRWEEMSDDNMAGGSDASSTDMERGGT